MLEVDREAWEVYAISSWLLMLPINAPLFFASTCRW